MHFTALLCTTLHVHSEKNPSSSTLSISAILVNCDITMDISLSSSISALRSLRDGLPPTLQFHPMLSELNEKVYPAAFQFELDALRHMFDIRQVYMMFVCES